MGFVDPTDSLWNATEAREGHLQALRDSLLPHPTFWLPVGEAIGLNLLVGTFNYLMGSEYAKISFETVAENFKTGFTWDADQFITNQFAHPYNGSLYHNFARSLGYDYWAGLGTAAIGSFQWEFFMENEPPAINDFIQTTVSGAALGEVLYRMSNMILDDRTTGSERVWREIAAGLLTPTRAFNRLVYGLAWQTTEEQIYERQPLSGLLAAGMNNIAEGVDFKNGNRNFLLTLDATYGRPFGRRTYKPFQFFRLQVGLNAGLEDTSDVYGIGHVHLYGILFGKIVDEGRSLILGGFQNYDYMANPVYRLGATSVAGGLLWRVPEWNSALTFQLGPILMGAANSVYAEQYKVASLDSSRDYNFGMGALTKIEGTWGISWMRLYVGYQLYWLHTLQGAPGDEFIGVWMPKVLFYPFGPWTVGLEWLLYHRRGLYHGLFPDIDLHNNEQRLFIGYTFGSSDP